ncbi:MAG: ABC transporter ATP-binding protein [Tumebacillaceae bacterium]
MLLKARNVTLWPSRRENSVSPILKNIHVSIAKGTCVTIIGPSGSGKSTLLRLLNRLQDPSEGIIEYADKPLTAWNVLELRRHIRMVFQTATMLPGTVFDNLCAVGNLPGGTAITRTQAGEMLDHLGLSQDMLDRDAAQLSGGQQARIALGRALIDLPPVVLFDEVTASLDPETKHLLETYVQDLHRKHHTTLLWVTHDLRQAERLGDVTWVIAGGELIEAGPTRELFQTPQHEITRRLLQESHPSGGERA